MWLYCKLQSLLIFGETRKHRAPANTPGPVFYPRIHDAFSRVRILSDGDLIDLIGFQCKPVLSTGIDQTYGDYFIMGEDSGPETLQVFYDRDPAVTTSERVKRGQRTAKRTLGRRGSMCEQRSRL